MNSAKELWAAAPGKRPRPYLFTLTHVAADEHEIGCLLAWTVTGGREAYQVALERTETGICWHCTCADYTFHSEDGPHACKHLRALVGDGRGRAHDTGPLVEGPLNGGTR